MSFCQVDISVFNALCIALIQMKFSTNREACLTESICKADIRNPLCDLSSDPLQRLIHTSGAVPAQVECYIRKSKLFQIIVYLCPAGFLHEFTEF